MARAPAKKSALRILFLAERAEALKSSWQELRTAGLKFKSQTAVSERDFRAALDKFKPELVISDHELSGFNGFAAMTIAREKCPDVPFIFVSGTPGEEAAVKALTKGAADYVLKRRLARLPRAVFRAINEYRDRSLLRVSAAKEKKLHELNRAVRTINETLVRFRTEPELFDKICRELARVSWIKFVWIGLVAEGTHNIKPAAWAGAEQGYLSTIKVRWDNSKYGRGPAGTAIRENRTVVIPDVSKDQFFKPWRKKALKRGFLSRAAIPLVYEGHPVGALNVSSGQFNAFGLEELKLLNSVAQDIAAGITSIRLAEKLAESEQKYRTLVETAQEGIWVVDADLRTTFVNDYMARMLGYSAQELIGTSVRQFLSPLQLRAARKTLSGIKTRPAAHYETELVKKNRERIWASVTVTTISDPEGKFAGAVGLVADVTAHREADEKSRRLYSLLVATRSISQSLIRVRDEMELYQQICNSLKNVWYIKFVWIGLVQKNSYQVLPAAQAGMGKGYLASIKVTWDDSKYGRGPTGMAVKTGKPFVMKDIENDPRFAAWRGEASKRGYASSLAVPIIHRGQVIACCNLYSAEKDVFGNEEIEFLMEAAADVAFGVNSLRMQEQLKQSERRFEQFIEGLPMAVLVLDAKGRPVYASKKESDLVGKGIGEVPPNAGLEHLARVYGVYVAGTGQFYPMKKAPLAKALAGEIASADDLEIRRGKEIIPVQVSAAPVFNDEGEVVYAVATTQDITERKQKERELAEEKELLSITLRSIGEGVITTDMKGKITALNRMAEKLTGVTSEQAVGEPLPKIFRIVDERTSTIQKLPSREGQASERVPEAQNQALLKAHDGKKRIIEYNSALMRDDQGRVIGAVLVFRDVTEKRRMEEELLAKTRLDSISVLSGGIAHDFNNILMGVLGNISLAKADVNPRTEIYQYLDAAGKAVRRAKDLTQQLLTFSRGRLSVKKAASLEALIRESASFILSGSKSKVEFSFPDDLWAVEVDEGQISQVFNNLILNADQAMLQGGTITIGAENIILADDNEIELPAGKYLKIFIQDQGVGIAQQDAGRIFDPFFTAKEHGTGLGLPISNAIVKNHNGKIEFESGLGIGSTFYVYLPASEKKVERISDEEAGLSAGRGRILLMDDMESVREIAGKMLARIGYEMEFVTDGAAAISSYQKAMERGEPFDAVIMDLTIPGGMGGKEAIRKLLELDPKLKAIASSGYPNDPGIAEFKKFGFKAIIIKPYEVIELSQTLRKVLGT